MTYTIPEQNLLTLEKRLAALSKRTQKAGNVPVTCTRTGNFKDEPTDKGLVRMVEVEVTGDAPSFNGWHFMATLCSTPDGNIVRAVPGYDVPPDYREGEHTCDHCNTIRQRRDTYVLKHDGGQTVRVGSSCLQDFLGHNRPDGLSLAARLCMEAHSMAEAATQRGWLGGGRMAETYRFDTHNFLCHVAQVVLGASGKFVTRSKARDAGSTSTADLAYNAMQSAYPVTVTPEADELATQARDYVRVTYSAEALFPPTGSLMTREILKDRFMASFGVQKTISDFEHNLLTVARAETIEPRLIGIAAYIIEAFRRSQPKPEAMSLNAGGLTRIFAMFRAAEGAELKKPAIRLMADGGKHLLLKLAAQTSGNAGHIYVKGPNGSDAYYGKISPDGRFLPVRGCPGEVGTKLQAFAAEPEKVAGQYGKLTGSCCFCSRPLTDKRSTEVGFGPVCAERFGLHWGAKASAEAEVAAVAA